MRTMLHGLLALDRLMTEHSGSGLNPALREAMQAEARWVSRSSGPEPRLENVNDADLPENVTRLPEREVRPARSA